MHFITGDIDCVANMKDMFFVTYAQACLTVDHVDAMLMWMLIE
jgi:hypothetical protein